MSKEPHTSSTTKRVLLPYICLAVFFVTLLSGSLLFISLYIKAPAPKAVTLIIPHGSSVQDIAQKLDENRLVIHPLLFRLSAKFMARNKLKAGEYTFPVGATVLDVTKRLRDGKTILRQITVAEGLSTYEIMQLINKNDSLTGAMSRIPKEGSLLPETYHYSYGDSRNNFVDRMKRAQAKLLKTLWDGRDQDLPFKTIEEAVILASIVEKETGQKAVERPLVASVFINRLRLGMPLQSDPTVIYAMTQGKAPLGRPLLRKDLSLESPTNTYRNVGLPPQPICNPGKAALEAVFHPTNTDWLYFVADGTGGHAFAKNLKGHNQNVARWIKIRKEQKKAQTK